MHWLATRAVPPALTVLLSATVAALAQQAGSNKAAPAGEQQVRVTCGNCHAFPPPDILPRSAWRGEVVRMMFIRDNRLPPVGDPDTVFKNIKLAPDMEQALAFYLGRAPERLPAPEPWPAAGTSPVAFTRTTMAGVNMPAEPAISNVHLVDFDGDKVLDVLATDMRQGLIALGRPSNPDGGLTTLASIPHPAHVTLTDIDNDSFQDLLVADLGSFLPADHDRGAVILLRGQPSGKFSSFWLDGWPRVADVEAADFNGDGKKDLVAAAFGWRSTGRVAILENRTANPARPDFVEHVIDKRPGGIHAIPVDLNRDGKMDFVTLLAQEFETVLAYINRGEGDFSFEQQVIYAAPHPNWGSSGIKLLDMDGDGDLDVLMTHGDTFDDGIVKPYHGIQWLENNGKYPFSEHTVAQMPGVHRADAADMDGDGDLDVVACALLAGGADLAEDSLPALVWLEQTKPGSFTRHTIEMGFPRHATLDLGDIDNDGDIDIVTGNFSIDKPTPAWVEVWTNQSKKAPTAVH